MYVKDLLKKKGHDVYFVNSSDKLKDVLKYMAEKKVGAVLVKSGDEIVGIFSERDFVRIFAEKGFLSEDTRIEELSTQKVLFVSLSEKIEECMLLMTSKRVRHLPVMENDQLVGLISIGDVVNSVIESQKGTIEQLEKYISGRIY